eukprot:TRINITY_DN1944_c0_g2_i2.p1 TRINITY_DN1944_c0_g2~~TRINITY_DN1944_c0_g2_i2.p1  ORF type:complete len:621 (+),score=104.52 TRINITY_DN1944_c0_g2_i2:254-1864(+)
MELEYEKVVATGNIYFKDGSHVDFSILLEFPNNQWLKNDNNMLMSHMVKKCYPPGKMIEYSQSTILSYPMFGDILIRFTVYPCNPETIIKGSVNGVPFKNCQLTKGNNIGEYNLFIESSNTASLRGTWRKDTFEGFWKEDDQEVSVNFKFLRQVFNHEHHLNDLGTIRINGILDAIHSSIFASKFTSPFYGVYETKEDPVKKIQSTLYVDKETALEIISIFEKLLLEHSKIAQWDSKIIEYGVETRHCKILRKSVPPVAILTLDFGPYNFEPEKYKHLFRTENEMIWESLPNLKNEVLSYLENLEQRSQHAFRIRAIREYQLSKEPKYWYSYERIYFLLCCNHSKGLSSLPLDVIHLICSFLPKSLYGCLNFGYQRREKDRYKNIQFKRKYLSLHPENNTFELVTLDKKESTTGLWKVVTSDGRPTILFTQVKSGTGRMQKDFVGVLNRDKWGKLKIDVDRRENQMNMDVDRIGRQLYTGIGQDHRDVWGLLYRRGEWGHTNTGADRRDKQFSLLEISAWHLSQIKGCNEYSINCQ